MKGLLSSVCALARAGPCSAWCSGVTSAAPGPDLARRELLRYGFVALLLVSELAAYGHHELAGWAWPWGAGFTSAFLVYALLSLALAYAARRALPPRWRPLALGLILGQGLAGLLFTLGLLPLASLRVELMPSTYISIRGFVFPQLLATGRFAAWFAYVGLGALLAGFHLALARAPHGSNWPTLSAWLNGLSGHARHGAVGLGAGRRGAGAGARRRRQRRRSPAPAPRRSPGARPARHRRSATHQHAAACCCNCRRRTASDAF